MNESELAQLDDGIYEGRGITIESEPCKWCDGNGKHVEFVLLKKEVLA